MNICSTVPQVCNFLTVVLLVIVVQIIVQKKNSPTLPHTGYGHHVICNHNFYHEAQQQMLPLTCNQSLETQQTMLLACIASIGWCLQ